MTSKQIDILNIFLIVISLQLAIKYPFELFLFSYAILGPLHYITEINWLKEKNYFVKNPKWMRYFILIGVAISIPVILRLTFFHQFKLYDQYQERKESINSFLNYLLLQSLLFAVALVYLKNQKQIIIAFLGCIVASILILKYINFSDILIGVFIPTIIHVYIFTLLFMIYGAIQSKNKYGTIGIVILILCPVIIAFSKFNFNTHIISENTKTIYIASSFGGLNSYIANLLKENVIPNLLLNDDLFFRIQVFISFCYTYHYLVTP